jgi:putative RNA 2'-phosphotransferase
VSSIFGLVGHFRILFGIHREFGYGPFQGRFGADESRRKLPDTNHRVKKAKKKNPPVCGHQSRWGFDRQYAMKHLQKVKKLAKFLDYLLGRHPEEFGLCPDEEGYVKIKDLIRAINEEDGWGYVRQSHLREVTAALAATPVELAGKRIRAVDRTKLVVPNIPENVPKLLYHPVRRRAHPVVLEKGVKPASSGSKIILARERSMAERLGRRMDASPVILTVNTDKLSTLGATLNAFGRVLFLTDGLPVGSFSGPPLPKTAPETKAAEKSRPPATPKAPGSYLVNLSSEPASKKKPVKKDRKRKNEWKRERKRKNRF